MLVDLATLRGVALRAAALRGVALRAAALLGAALRGAVLRAAALRGVAFRADTAVRTGAAAPTSRAGGVACSGSGSGPVTEVPGHNGLAYANCHCHRPVDQANRSQRAQHPIKAGWSGGGCPTLCPPPGGAPRISWPAGPGEKHRGWRPKMTVPLSTCSCPVQLCDPDMSPLCVCPDACPISLAASAPTP